LPWLILAIFAVTLVFFGWAIAFLHASILTVSNVLVIEILLVKNRKIPFTCSFPKFESLRRANVFGILISNTIPIRSLWAEQTRLLATPDQHT
jgi:Na+-translocating ferredoxin:NAD+ oxidoreductase RnfD subunit